MELARHCDDTQLHIDTNHKQDGAVEDTGRKQETERQAVSRADSRLHANHPYHGKQATDPDKNACSFMCDFITLARTAGTSGDLWSRLDELGQEDGAQTPCCSERCRVRIASLAI